jgi:hypothetical protein
MREKMVPAEGIGIFRGIENRQLQNVENGEIDPDWNADCMPTGQVCGQLIKPMIRKVLCGG